jgi:hypothetical protein
MVIESDDQVLSPGRVRINRGVIFSVEFWAIQEFVGHRFCPAVESLADRLFKRSDRRKRGEGFQCGPFGDGFHGFALGMGKKEPSQTGRKHV